MKRMLSLALLTTVLFGAHAFAADPIIGTWKLNVAKSKFIPGHELTAGARTYTESNGLYTIEQKQTGADGKEVADKASYKDGQEVKAPGGVLGDATVAKKIDDRHWDFDIKRAGKVVGHIHRSVSADGKTLTVQSTGTTLAGATGEQKLVFDKQ